jgi:phage terminase small subunit
MFMATTEEVLVNQQRFFEEYVKCGSLTDSAQLAGIKRSTVKGWYNKDTQGFKGKYAEAKEEYREYLQTLALERIKQQKPSDNPVLLITMLNAEWPEKYRRDSKIESDGVKDMMNEWKEWVKDNSQKSKEDPQVTEAEQARRNAIDEVEKMYAKKSDDDSK